MGLALSIGGHARNHRDIAGIKQGEKHCRIYCRHLSHQPIYSAGVGAGPHQGAIAAAKSHGPAPHLIEAVDNVFVDPAHQHHLDHVHGFRSGDPQTITEFGLDLEAIQPVIDLRAAAMNHHRLHPHRGQQHHIAVDSVAKLRLHHRRTAVLDHHPAARKALDVWKGLT